MRDGQSAVADTHALLYHARGDARLGTRARRLFALAESREALIHVPVAVLWEIAMLTRSGRVNLRRSVREFVADVFSNPSYQPHPLDTTQVLTAGELRTLRDPFDGLIVAAALDLGLPLVSRDAAIVESRYVKTVW